MTDFLEEKKQEIEARLTELRPLVEEYERLEAAARALDGVNGAPRSSSSSSRRRGGGGRGSGKRGRPKGSGTRGTQALDLVKEHPGITIPDLAEKMQIKQNYLYRVLPGLEQDGLVEKRDRGWYAREAA